MLWCAALMLWCAALMLWWSALTCALLHGSSWLHQHRCMLLLLCCHQSCATAHSTLRTTQHNTGQHASPATALPQPPPRPHPTTTHRTWWTQPLCCAPAATRSTSQPSCPSQSPGQHICRARQQQAPPVHTAQPAPAAAPRALLMTPSSSSSLLLSLVRLKRPTLPLCTRPARSC
jgi:hypothetical protein